MKTESLGIPGPLRIFPPAFADHRGWLVRGFDAALFANAGLPTAWVQQVISHTETRHTLRGLHAQRAPFTEAKLILPVSGRMWWVVVDFRADSPTRLQWRGVELDAAERAALYVPRGFGHGCVSLTDQVTLAILADNAYSPEHGIGIAWNDPDLAIDWPLPDEARLVQSTEHAGYRSLAEVAELLKL